MGIDGGSYEPSVELFMKLAVVWARLGSTLRNNMRIIPVTHSTSRRLLYKPRYISLIKYLTLIRRTPFPQGIFFLSWLTDNVARINPKVLA